MSTLPVDAPTAVGGVGHSDADDSAEVARVAVTRALGDRTPSAGDLVLLFPNADYDLPVLHAAAMDAAGPAQVVGATTCGAFTHEATVPRGCVAIHLAADDMAFGIRHVARGEDLAATARDAASAARDRAGGEREHAALLMLCDGKTPDQRALARGAFEVTGALVPIVGGAAGDGLAWEATSTFGEGVVRDDGLVCVWIASSRPMAVTAGHGWRPFGKPMLVTRASGNIVHELDGEPAVDAYLSERGADLREGRSIGERAITRPVGLPNAFGGYDLRQIHEFTDDGGIVLTTAVPEQSVVRVMASDPDALLEGATDAADTAREDLTAAPRMAIVFSCVTREVLLGERLPEEVATISERLGGVPAAGFLTCGEFAKVPGSTGIHNSTVALLTV